jgi:Peptidase family C25
MKKELFIIIFLTLIQAIAFSQPYNNEWINFEQEYFKFSVLDEGVYRIYPSNLVDAGINIGSFDPQNIQVLRNGQEIPIYIEGESSGVIEFIEFYAYGNDGSFDVDMYQSADDQINPYYSLINSTAYYFLTWNSEFNNKRISSENDTDFVGISSFTHYWKDTLIDYTSAFLHGYTDCEYTTGEGYHDNQSLSVGATVTKQYIFNNIFSDGGESEVSFAISGFSDNEHHLTASINNNQIIDTSYRGRNSIRYNTSFNSSLLEETNAFALTSIDDDPVNENTDYSALNYFKIKYPCTNNLHNRKQFVFLTEEVSESKIIEFIHLESLGSHSFILDIINEKRYSTVSQDSSIKTKVSNVPADNKFIVYAENTTHSINDLEKITFTNYNTEKSFVIISHEDLWLSALEYSNYRNALLVDIEELYNQFAFGIRKHPLAIRHFVDYITDNWETKPSSLLLLGKGINSIDSRTNSANFDDCLIPTMGNPPSDILMLTRINNTLYEPTIPIGRISAKNNSEVRDYLNKVKEFEQQEPGEWMKRMIHFGGGIIESEQITFAQYLKTYENIIEDTLTGAIVSTFLKNSSDPIQITQTDSVKKLINGGVSLMTFFGHAYTGGFDQNIDDPSSFDNYGKYPLLLANSCYSGNIHLPGSSSTSENWVLSKKGTIAFFAVVFEGYSTTLHKYSLEFYKNLAYKNYGKSLGEIIKQTVLEYQSSSSANQLVKNMCLEFTLHGDPSIVLNAFEKPDLTIGNSSVFFEPQNISTAIDSFHVNVVTTNIGKAIRDTFLIHINRVFPDGSESSITKELYSCLYKDTISFKFPVDIIKGSGNNLFDIFIDQSNKIDELSEINNTKQANLFIRSSTLVPVYPYDLGVVSNSTISLKSSTGDPFSAESSYSIEIDTSMSFNSSFKKTHNTMQTGGVIEWDLPFELEENIVYWWRVGKVPSADEEYYWITSSFSYSPGNHGWAMSDFDQMKQNSFNFIEQNETTRKYDFINTPKLLRCHNIGSPSLSQASEIQYDIDGNLEWDLCGGVTSLVVAVMDSLSLIPWESNKADYGHYDYPKCFSRSRPDRYFIFRNDEAGLSSFVNFIENIIPEGDHILIYSFGRIIYTNWTEDVFEAFENLGSDLIRSVPNNHPIIYYAQKGKPNSAIEIIGEASSDIIDLEHELKSNFYYGTIESPIIGPSNNWESIQIDIDEASISNSDSVQIQIIGLTNNLEESILFDDILSDTIIQNISSRIDAEEFPYFRISFFSIDETFKTPVNLNSWSVYYECSGELAINPQKGFYFYSDTLQQGDSLIFSAAIENTSPFDMDSLVIKYWIQNNFNETILTSIRKVDSLKANHIFNDTIRISTININSSNYIWIEANPINENMGNYYQKEALHFNNIANTLFYVKKDTKNPILDVTFDGYHIIDGEIISANPEITIQLFDENLFLPLNDTSLFNIYLKSYESGIEKRISFSSTSENITFIPAELPDNKCQIIYNPTFTEDGKYALRVQSVDASNNVSGDFDYQISFEIITKSTITNIVNYPNPFSTSTQFVFTLTGSEIPEDLRIQIFTISGKYVKEIDLTLDGQIRIGKNITEYTWDGTDMFGDKLANGVYLYRVFSKLNGQSIERRETQADGYFHKGFGKMVILR